MRRLRIPRGRLLSNDFQNLTQARARGRDTQQKAMIKTNTKLPGSTDQAALQHQSTQAHTAAPQYEISPEKPTATSQTQANNQAQEQLSSLSHAGPHKPIINTSTVPAIVKLVWEPNCLTKYSVNQFKNWS